MSLTPFLNREPSLALWRSIGIRIFLFTLTALALSAEMVTAETIYAVVLGNQKYLVGSSTLNSGLFRSTDHGRTWEHLGPRNLKAYAMDAVDSSRGRILYIAAGNGVHKSTDGGATWRITTDWRVTEVLDVKVDQHDPRRVYAASAFGFLRSTDGGETWENPKGLLQMRYLYRIDKIEQSGELTASGEDAVYVSYDHGDSWSYQIEMRQPRGTFTVGQYGKAIAGDQGPLWYPSSEYATSSRPGSVYPRMNTFDITHRNDTVFAAGNKGIWIYLISSRSAAWRDITGELPTRTVHAVATTREAIIIGTFGDGLFRFENGSWIPTGLEGAQIWSLEVKEW